MNHETPELARLRQAFHQQVLRLRSSETEQRQNAARLLEIMETMYDVDLQQRQSQLKRRSTKLEESRASLEHRRQQRDEIITAELERLANGDQVDQKETGDELFSKPAGVQFQIVSDNTEHGTRMLKVHTVSFKCETWTREISFIAEVEESRSKVIDGVRLESTVVVPEMRVKKEAVEVQIPVFRTIEFEVPADENWEDIAMQKLLQDPERQGGTQRG